MGSYRATALTSAEAMEGVHALLSSAHARDHLFGLRGTELLVIDPSGRTARHTLPNWASSVFAIDDEVYFTGGLESPLNRWNWETRTIEDHSAALPPEVSSEWYFESMPRANGGAWLLSESNAVVGFDGQRAWRWPGSDFLAKRSIQLKHLVEKVLLRDLCDTSFTILNRSDSAARYEFRNQVPATLALHADKHQLLDIVLNLLSNARDAVDSLQPDSGFIAAAATEDPKAQRLSLTIVDNGIGMDKAESAKAFVHGFTTKTTGHGFGLHSAANAAKALGGELTLESPGLNLGATATLTLPLRAAVPADSSAADDRLASNSRARA